MNRNERYEDPQQALLAALAGERADVWTAMPGFIVSFDGDTQTASVQITIRALFTSPVDGSQDWIEIKPLLDCPVHFPRGGNCVFTFPVVAGDECLVVFASRCIDAWWQNGGIQNQAELRMHNLSDGFAFVGFNSVPNVVAAVSATAAQLRTADGTAHVSLDGTSKNVDVVTPSVVNVTASAINLGPSGGTLQSLVDARFQALFNAHVHPIPGGNSGAPTISMGAGQLTSVVKGG